jgi:hypothetical protein
MRTAEIYFNGQIIKTVKCDGWCESFSKDGQVLVLNNNTMMDRRDVKVVAIVPFDHLIVFKDEITVEIKGSDLVGIIDSTLDRK